MPNQRVRWESVWVKSWLTADHGLYGKSWLKVNYGLHGILGYHWTQGDSLSKVAPSGRGFLGASGHRVCVVMKFLQREVQHTGFVA